MVTSTKPKGKHGRRADDAAPDRGCEYAPRCVDCIWRQCIKELPAHERGDFISALRVVHSHLAAPDGTLG